jgi:RNA polymerase sigma-70 factor (ECF subfamily)
VSQASTPSFPGLAALPADAAGERGAAHMRRMVERQHAFVWRSLRRLGVAPGEVDDGVQKVFLIAARKLCEIDPDGERRFLFATALRVAANERRAHVRRRDAGAAGLEEMAAPEPSPEKVTADRALLDALLGTLTLDLRSVFVLFELEQMTTDEIALVLELPVGTVSSRLRRGRELVEAKARRLRAHPGEKA